MELLEKNLVEHSAVIVVALKKQLHEQMHKEVKELHLRGIGQGLFTYPCSIIGDDIATTSKDPPLSSTQCPKCKMRFLLANRSEASCRCVYHPFCLV